MSTDPTILRVFVTECRLNRLARRLEHGEDFDPAADAEGFDPVRLSAFLGERTVPDVAERVAGARRLAIERGDPYHELMEAAEDFGIDAGLLEELSDKESFAADVDDDERPTPHATARRPEPEQDETDESPAPAKKKAPATRNPPRKKKRSR